MSQKNIAKGNYKNKKLTKIKETKLVKKEVNKNIKKGGGYKNKRYNESWEFHFIEKGTEDKFDFDKNTVEKCSFEEIFKIDKGNIKKFKDDTIVIIYSYYDENNNENIIKIPYNVCIKYKYLNDIKKGIYFKNSLHNEFIFSKEAFKKFIELIINKYTLIGAIENNDINSINKLLYNNSEIDNYIEERDFEENTPLHLAILRNNINNIDIIEKLLDKHANINAKNNLGNTPLHLAILNRDIELIEMLLENNANVNAKNRGDKTPLHSAIVVNNIDIVELLLKYNADINTKDNLGNTPLHSAIVANNIDIVKLLLNTKKINVNAKDNLGNTPLHYIVAVNDIDIEIIKELLKYKDIKINEENVKGNIPLHYAVSISDKNIIKELLNNGADINFKNKSDKTPLYVANQIGNKEIINILLANYKERRENTTKRKIPTSDGYTVKRSK